MDGPLTQAERATLIENAVLGHRMRKLALHALYSFEGQPGVGFPALARRMEVAKSTAMRRIGELFEMGVIDIRPRRRPHNRGTAPNGYTIKWQRLMELQLDDRGRRGAEPGSDDEISLFEGAGGAGKVNHPAGPNVCGGSERDRVSECDRVSERDPVAESDPPSREGRERGETPPPPPRATSEGEKGEQDHPPPEGLGGPAPSGAMGGNGQPGMVPGVVDAALFAAGVVNGEARLAIYRAGRRRAPPLVEREADGLLVACGFDDATAGEVAWFIRPHRIQRVIAYAIGQINGGTEIRRLAPWMAALLGHKDYLSADDVFAIRATDENARFLHMLGSLRATFGRKRNGKAATCG